MKWRSIRTAPKDGTAVLVWDGDDIGIAWWENPYLLPARWTNGEESYEIPPTYWMPLPDPPNTHNTEV